MVLRIHTTFLRRPVAAIGNVLILVGACTLVFWAWNWFQAPLYQYVQRTQFATTEEPSAVPASQSNNQPSAAIPKAPRLHSVLPGLFRPDPQVIGRLDMPEVGLSVMIREGVDDDTLRKAAGHLPSSVLPGQPGNFVLLGHRDTLFRPLRGINRGDSLNIQTKEAHFTYVVDSLEVTSPDAVRIDSGPEPSATLITCFPFTYIGPAPRRLVIHARLVAKTHEK